MHPYISQSLTDVRVADRHRAAAAARQARQSRQAARRARRQGVTSLPNPQPALETIPAPDRALAH